MHYFLGQPIAMSSPWASTVGKEIKTEALASDGSTVLQRVETSWQYRRSPSCFVDVPTYNPCGLINDARFPNVAPIAAGTTATLVDSNLVSKVSMVDPATQALAIDQNLNPTDVWYYDYGSGQPGSFLKREHTDYVSDSNYVNRFMRTLPSQKWVSPDASGTTKASLTQYEYDNYSADTNHASLWPRSNVSGFDSTNFSESNTIRGNVTAVTSYANAQSQTGAVTAYSQYDVLGNVVKMKDPNGNASTVSYNDNFGSPNEEARTNTAPAQLNGLSTFAFPTSGTNAMGWVTGYSQVDYFTGASVNTEDLNGVISKTFYNDALDRPTQAVTAVGTTFERQSTIAYSDSTRTVQSTSDLNELNDNLLKSVSIYDGLGRTIESRKYEANGNYKATQTQYVALSRPYKHSNPFRNNEVDSTHPIIWTTSTFDALGRMTQIETPDGAKVKTAYDGNRTLVTDQAEKKRLSVTNAAGQLKEVWEITPNDQSTESISFPNQTFTTGYKTTYVYDSLNNLATVNQGGQTRTFAYNNLSRLTSADNPESGMVSSTFDPNGNILTQRDERGIKTVFDYDALNRISKKCHRVIGTGGLGATSCAQASGEQIEPNTSDVAYTYDDPSVPFSKGKLTKIENGVSSTQFTAFSAEGDVLSHKQTVDGNDYTTGYTYTLGGSLSEETYPSGRVVKNTFENDGGLSQVLSKQDANHGYSRYASHIGYSPSGRVTSMRLGNNAWESVQLNSRLQPTQIAVGTTQNAVDLWKINYDFGELQSDGTVDTTKNNSNIGKQTVTVPTVGSTTGLTAIQTFTYDSIKRLKTAAETVGGNPMWKQTFNYDQYGNRTFDSANTTTIPLGCSTALCNPSINAANNRFDINQNYLYDNSGNLIQNADNAKFVYDASNKIVEARNETTNALVSKNYYDGDGTRIKIDENGVSTIFVHDAYGKTVAEYTVNAPANPTPKVNYMTLDLLGTPRVITDENRKIASRRDMMPFGEEISAGVGNRSTGQGYSNAADGVREKFTGQERDEVVKLDYFNARHYTFALGRFMSADNFGGKLSNPQSLNLYAYALNNPLKWVDPTGHFADDPADYCTDCTLDKNGYLHHADGTVWEIPKADAIVNVNSDGVPAGPSSVTENEGSPDLPDSPIDLLPVAGSGRRMLYNMSCHNGGGCNINRAVVNFIHVSVDAATLLEGIFKIGGKLFAEEVAEETTEIGVTSGIRQAPEFTVIEQAEDAVHLSVNTSKGPVEIMAGLSKQGDTLIMDAVHVEGTGANQLGRTGFNELKAAGREFGRQNGVSKVLVNPGKRTSGRMKGRTPSSFTISVGPK